MSTNLLPQGAVKGLSSVALIYDTPTVDAAGTCTASLGYICEWNRRSASGSWPGLVEQPVLDEFALVKDSLVDHYGFRMCLPLWLRMLVLARSDLSACLMYIHILSR
jgi:hypothetical protein